MTSRALGWALLVVVMLVTAACTGEAEPVSTGTIEAAPEPTPTATAPATVEPTPEPTEPTLTVEEAQEILDELARIEGDVFRMLKYAGDEVPPPAYERLEAAFAGRHLEQGQEALPDFADLPPESFVGGDPVREALTIEGTTGSCVAVRADEDYSEVLTSGRQQATLLALIPGAADEVNSTGWRMARQVLAEDHEELTDNPCDDL